MEFEHEPTTAHLIALAQIGTPAGEQAWDALLIRYWAPVYRLCWRYLGDAAQAEDAAQETWLRASQAIGRFAPRADDPHGTRFERWLLRIARNLCLDILRARERAAEERPLVPDGAREDDLPDPGPAPPEQAVSEELRDTVGSGNTRSLPFHSVGNVSGHMRDVW
jgi:RNA polymerase sigma factor (sigma-70 family)